MNRPTPIARRQRSTTSIVNTQKVLKAILKSAAKNGLDELSASHVAKLCGLTTGAVYSRYEDANEMAIALWDTTVKAQFKARLQRSVDYIYGSLNGLQTNSLSLVEIADSEAVLRSDFETPDEIAKLGAEFLVVAKRNSTIGEVVIPEVSGWFTEFGLNETNDGINNAAIALGLSSSIGTGLRALILKSNSNWFAIAGGLRSAVGGATPLPKPADLATPREINVETDNPVRNALVNAVAVVVAKSGYADATISRILRRAGLANGSLYNLYKNKEELTDDAMNLSLNVETDANREGNRLAIEENRTDRGLANSFVLGLIPERRMWLDFRLECLIASRSHLPTHAKFKEHLEVSRDDLAIQMPDLSRGVVNLLSSGEQAIGLGFTTLELFTPHLHNCDFYSVMVCLAKQNALLGSA